MFSRKPSDEPAESSPAARPGTPEGAAATTGRRFTDSLPACASTLAAGLRVRGAITGSGSIRIEGELEGRIEIDGLCHIARGARAVGPIAAGDAIVEGELEGQLVVRGRVELRATAVVRADVDARTVAVAEGCFYEGRMNMGSGAGPSGPVTFREKRRRRPAAPAEPQAATPAPPAPAPDKSGAETKPAGPPPPAKPPSATT